MQRYLCEIQQPARDLLNPIVTNTNAGCMGNQFVIGNKRFLHMRSSNSGLQIFFILLEYSSFVHLIVSHLVNCIGRTVLKFMIY
jgi:hypothetical protein